MARPISLITGPEADGGSATGLLAPPPGAEPGLGLLPPESVTVPSEDGSVPPDPAVVVPDAPDSALPEPEARLGAVPEPSPMSPSP